MGTKLEKKREKTKFLQISSEDKINLLPLQRENTQKVENHARIWCNW